VSVSEAGETLSSRHVSSCDVTRAVGDVRGDLTLNSMAQIHAFSLCLRHVISRGVLISTRASTTLRRVLARVPTRVLSEIT